MFMNPWQQLHQVNRTLNQLRKKGFPRLSVAVVTDNSMMTYSFPDHMALQFLLPAIWLLQPLAGDLGEAELIDALFAHEKRIYDALGADADILAFTSGVWKYNESLTALVYSISAYSIGQNAITYVDAYGRKQKLKAQPMPVPQLMKFDPHTNKPECWPSEAAQYRSVKPDVVWIYNPYTGERRLPAAIDSDPHGVRINYENPIIAAPALNKAADPLRNGFGNTEIHRADSSGEEL